MSDDKVLQLTKLLAEAKAAEEAKKKKDPSVAAAEEEFRKREQQLELARVAVDFARMGPYGDIHNETTKENAQRLVKSLQAVEQLLAGQNQHIQAAWFTNKNNAAFLVQVNELFCDLTGTIIALLHPLNIGNYNQEVERMSKMQEDSRKRQRVAEEKDAPRPPRLGCTCGTNREGSHHKCGARCPCQKDGKPCSDRCRCTVDNCQNVAGVPPARPERRGRPPLHVPVSGYMNDLEPTQRFPTNRRTSASERSYQDDDEDDWERYRQPRTKQTARQATHTHARTHTHTHAQAPPFPLFGKGFSSDITGDGPRGAAKNNEIKIHNTESIIRNMESDENKLNKLEKEKIIKITSVKPKKTPKKKVFFCLFLFSLF